MGVKRNFYQKYLEMVLAGLLDVWGNDQRRKNMANFALSGAIRRVIYEIFLSSQLLDMDG